MSAPIAANEAARLSALRKYAILDTPHEAAFERLTRLAARLLDVPISLLSLVDEDRQWFKSTYGFKRRQTPREISFCAHAILGDTVMVVPDASRDARFCKLAVETHGGSIGVSSQPGAGSTFWFTLPRSQDESNGA